MTTHKLLPSEPTDEMLIAGVIAVRDSDNDNSEVSNETIVLAMDVLKIAYRAMWIDSPEVEQEPVAYAWKYRSNFMKVSLAKQNNDWIPLYTHPQPPSTEQEASRTQGMTLKQRIEHVGGTFIKDDLVVFGSIMAVNALIGHVIRDIPPQPKREPLSKEALGSLWEMYGMEDNSIPFARAIEKAHGIGVE